ncbi:MAG: ATP-binding cassette domain-containing protein [Sphingobacteriia bacterium]|nr:ATP-binding cassette domain-containing protein [Sphingobacteriia bacterium]NCC38492.1 ATP-binding cassette domain-containing protein [Gammaproteobacteria bacterium]
MPLLTLSGLVAGHGDPVIGPVSLRVMAGEVVGLWGPNGCGKSTLLNAIIDRAVIFAGQIERAPRLRLAYQEQWSVRLPIMPVTGGELLRLMGACDQALPDALRCLLRRRIDRLSGGQYQLLRVWAALSGGADLILLDEPTNNLDPERESLLLQMLAKVPAQRSRRLLDVGSGRAVLLVSHERRFLDAACSRVIEIG